MMPSLFGSFRCPQSGKGQIPLLLTAQPQPRYPTFRSCLQTGFAEWASHVGLEPGDTVHMRRVAPARFVFTRWEAEGGSTSDGGSASMADDSDLAGFYGASRGGGSRGTSGRGNRGSEGDSGRGNSGGSRLPRLAARGTAQPEAPCGSQPQPQQQRQQQQQPQQRQRESQQLEHVLIKTGPSAFQTAADAIAAGELRRYVCASAAESLLLEVPSESALHPPPACNNMMHCSTWLASCGPSHSNKPPPSPPGFMFLQHAWLGASSHRPPRALHSLRQASPVAPAGRHSCMPLTKLLLAHDSKSG